ncbi:MAG: DUF3160 domain-containing protein [Bacteroidaceae bacterium]|nr:DUF3160 domain-containing protein [Bacteroidaceae bacterium]
MKHLVSLLLLVSISLQGLCQNDDSPLGPEQTEKATPFVLPGKGKINVETLNQPINLSMDISKLNLLELKVLRNAIYAQKGHIFTTGEMRGIFGATTWWESLALKRWDSEQANQPIQLAPEEKAFVERVKAREKELQQLNFKPKKGQIVNTNNIINTYQLTPFPAPLQKQLGRDGFAIVDGGHDQLFEVYERNDYALFPNFVTTDLYLQLYHLYVDCVLREVEEQYIAPQLTAFCKRLHQDLTIVIANAKNETMKAAAEWNQAYIAIAIGLLTNEAMPAVAKIYETSVGEEMMKILKTEDNLAPFLGYNDVKYPYSLYRPRGHYTRTETLQRYFRAMMWIQDAPYGTDDERQMQRAALMASVIANDDVLSATYKRITEPLTFLMGTPDNVSVEQVYNIMQRQHITASRLMTDRNALKAFIAEVDQLAEQQTRIRPPYERSSHNKVNIMPQRYQPDAEVMLRMVDYDNKPTRRDTPDGLDIFAAMEVTAAERILIGEMKQDKQWNQFMPMLTNMKQTMRTFNWNTSVSSAWLRTVADMCQPNQQYPYFMKTPAWDKKNLNAALASWAELKHDAILYAKQPFGAECGGGDFPTPVTKGYVEPNTTFWTKAIDLLDMTTRTLNRFGALSERLRDAGQRMKEQAQFLLNVSQKELRKEQLSREEYDQIRIIGSTFENISLQLLKKEGQEMYEWAEVQGADKKVALIADVYTANADNNPNKSILFAGVGNADEIYVIVEIDGWLYLTRGAVLSYRQQKQGLNQQRLTDEEWQKKLETNPLLGRPHWMNSIICPLKQQPQVNEKVFYSSGC